VTDADAKAEYDKFAAANSGKEYKASHILVEKEAEAKAIIASSKKAASSKTSPRNRPRTPAPAPMAASWTGPTAGSYVPEFSDAMVGKLDKGKMTDTPVKSQFGYHIIRLDDVREAQLPKFEDVKPQITQQLSQQKLAEFQQSLRTKAKVE
jgi:peptidyl-prolyl cis-trans isomerase C